MRHNTNNQKLIEAMRRENLSAPDVAEILGVSLDTVKHWRVAPGLSGHRNMPDWMLELFLLKLGEK